jgi:hypothetical protein
VDSRYVSQVIIIIIIIIIWLFSLFSGYRLPIFRSVERIELLQIQGISIKTNPQHEGPGYISLSDTSSQTRPALPPSLPQIPTWTELEIIVRRSLKRLENNSLSDDTAWIKFHTVKDTKKLKF